LVSELGPVVERARQRFEARDAAGVLAHVSEQYRSGGSTKADLRQQLLAMFALYEVLSTGVIVGDVQVVDDAVWVYTSGEVSGRLPFLGWVTVLTCLPKRGGSGLRGGCVIPESSVGFRGDHSQQHPIGAARVDPVRHARTARHDAHQHGAHEGGAVTSLVNHPRAGSRSTAPALS
jgi:hypothetical protein